MHRCEPAPVGRSRPHDEPARLLRPHILVRTSLSFQNERPAADQKEVTPVRGFSHHRSVVSRTSEDDLELARGLLTRKQQ